MIKLIEREREREREREITPYKWVHPGEER